MLYLLIFIAATLMAILSALMGWIKIFMISCVVLYVFNTIIKIDGSNK